MECRNQMTGYLYTGTPLHTQPVSVTFILIIISYLRQTQASVRFVFHIYNISAFSKTSYTNLCYIRDQ
jgi:hypothetical protein